MSHYSTPQNRTKQLYAPYQLCSYLASVGTYICPLPVQLGIPTQLTHIHAQCTLHIPTNKESPRINSKPQLSISQDNASQCLGHEVGAVFVRECGLQCDCELLYDASCCTIWRCRGPSDTQYRWPVTEYTSQRKVHTYTYRYAQVHTYVCSYIDLYEPCICTGLSLSFLVLGPCRFLVFE